MDGWKVRTDHGKNKRMHNEQANLFNGFRLKVLVFRGFTLYNLLQERARLAPYISRAVVISFPKKR